MKQQHFDQVSIYQKTTERSNESTAHCLALNECSIKYAYAVINIVVVNCILIRMEMKREVFLKRETNLLDEWKGGIFFSKICTALTVAASLANPCLQPMPHLCLDL